MAYYNLSVLSIKFETSLFNSCCYLKPEVRQVMCNNLCYPIAYCEGFYVKIQTENIFLKLFILYKYT